MDGWIKLHRQLSDNPLWISEQFTSGQAWVDLLLLSNHKPGIINVRGIRINIERGQCGWSSLSLSRRWKWSRGKVLRFLDFLVQQKMIIIVQQKARLTTIITIVNYLQYQKNSTTDGTIKQTTDSTTNGQQTDTNKNVKNVKKETKTYSLDSFELKLSEALWTHICTLGTASKRPDMQKWCNEFRLIHERDKRSWDFINQLLGNIFNDDFWKDKIKSPGKLRHQINNGNLDRLLPEPEPSNV